MVMVQCFSRSWLAKTRPACGSSGSTATRKGNVGDEDRRPVGQSVAKDGNVDFCKYFDFYLAFMHTEKEGLQGTLNLSPQISQFLNVWLIKCWGGFWWHVLMVASIEFYTRLLSTCCIREICCISAVVLPGRTVLILFFFFFLSNSFCFCSDSSVLNIMINNALYVCQKAYWDEM